MDNRSLTPFESRVAGIVNELTSGVSNPEQWLLDALDGNAASTGHKINAGTALSLPAVWNSVFRIAGHIGMLPVEIHRPTSGNTYKTSTIMPGHPAAQVLNGPNIRQTGQIFRETVQANALLSGNGKALIERNMLGQPVELLLLPPDYCWTMMWEGRKWHILNLPLHYTGRLGEQYTEAPGAPPNGWYRVPDSEIFHIPGLSYDGLWGIDVLFNSRDVFGLDKAGQDAAGYSFRNNGRPGLLLEAPRNALTTAKAAKEFLDAFNDMHQGLDNKGKTGLIREGMKAHILPTSSLDSQHIEQRQFSREDIALLFGTESVLGEGSAVYKDRQDRMVAYLQNCLGRWFQRWNHEAQRKLFSDRDRAAGVFLKFNTEALINADPNTLADYTGKLTQQKIVSVNEVRAMHGLNPVEGGDEVGGVQEEEPEPEAEPEQKETAEDDGAQARIAKRAVEAVFRGLIGIEQQKVRAASKHADFDARLEKFYFHHRQMLRDTCREFELGECLADAHCDDSRELITDMASVCGENLTENVRALVADWKDRAKEFSDAV